MAPETTCPHGTILRPIAGGYRLRRDSRTIGRVFVRLVNVTAGSRWRAACDLWDGFTWNRDRTIEHQDIARLESAVRDYANWIDHHAYVASGDCHN